MTRGSRLMAAILAAIFAFPAMASAFVRPGDLDTTWGGTGIFQTVIGNINTVATPAGVAVIPKKPGQPDDKVVVAGGAVKTVAGSPRKVFAIIRYNADGTPDPRLRHGRCGLDAGG